MPISFFYHLIALGTFTAVMVVSSMVSLVVPNGGMTTLVGTLVFGMFLANLWLTDIAYSLRKANNRGYTTKD